MDKLELDAIWHLKYSKVNIDSDRTNFNGFCFSCYIGAINFTRDSFLKIDMYACGLVLWELVSRCSYNEIPCDEYSLPFENEVGPNPTIEDMQDIVAQQKKRPHIKDSWLKHPGMALIVSTMQDCWDQEAEARISAETICERINSLKLNNDSVCVFV